MSERTIYRDVADLMRSGIPILGEAGVGYRIEAVELTGLRFALEGEITLDAYVREMIRDHPS